VDKRRNDHRAVVKRIPLMPPNVDRATQTGMIHAMKPYMRCANVYNTPTYTDSWYEKRAKEFDMHICLFYQFSSSLITTAVLAPLQLQVDITLLRV